MKIEKLTGVYKITNIVNKKIYIGSSVNCEKRWNIHKNLLLKNKHHSRIFQNSWNKYGSDNFTFEIICFCDIENLLRFEQKCLDVYVPELNICKIAGNTFGTRRTEESKQKIRLKRKKQIMASWTEKRIEIMSQKMSGENNPMFGKLGTMNGIKMSFDSKQKMRKSKEKLMTPIERIDCQTGEVKEYLCKQDVIKDGFNGGCVWMCCNNHPKYKQYKGFYWNYLDTEELKSVISKEV